MDDIFAFKMLLDLGGGGIVTHYFYNKHFKECTTKEDVVAYLRKHAETYMKEYRIDKSSVTVYRGSESVGCL